MKKEIYRRYECRRSVEGGNNSEISMEDVRVFKLAGNLFLTKKYSELRNLAFLFDVIAGQLRRSLPGVLRLVNDCVA